VLVLVPASTVEGGVPPQAADGAASEPPAAVAHASPSVAAVIEAVTWSPDVGDVICACCCGVSAAPLGLLPTVHAIPATSANPTKTTERRPLSMNAGFARSVPAEATENYSDL
jgi:hypothetical protein